MEWLKAPRGQGERENRIQDTQRNCPHGCVGFIWGALTSFSEQRQETNFIYISIGRCDGMILNQTGSVFLANPHQGETEAGQLTWNKETHGCLKVHTIAQLFYKNGHVSLQWGQQNYPIPWKIGAMGTVSKCALFPSYETSLSLVL